MATPVRTATTVRGTRTPVAPRTIKAPKVAGTKTPISAGTKVVSKVATSVEPKVVSTPVPETPVVVPEPVPETPVVVPEPETPVASPDPSSTPTPEAPSVVPNQASTPDESTITTDSPPETSVDASTIVEPPVADSPADEEVPAEASEPADETPTDQPEPTEEADDAATEAGEVSTPPTAPESPDEVDEPEGEAEDDTTSPTIDPDPEEVPVTVPEKAKSAQSAPAETKPAPTPTPTTKGKGKPKVTYSYPTICPRCNKRPGKDDKAGYCGVCARNKDVQAIINGAGEGKVETNHPQPDPPVKAKVPAVRTKKGASAKASTCPHCNKRQGKVDMAGYCGTCARTKVVQALIRDAHVTDETPVPDATDETNVNDNYTPEVKEEAPAPTPTVKKGRGKAKVAAADGDQEPKETKGKSKGGRDKIPGTLTAKEKRELAPKCKRCDKSPAKEDCEGWCGSCYRTNAVKEELRKKAMGPHREFEVEPLDSADAPGIVRHIGTDVVLRIDAGTNTYTTIGRLSAPSLVAPGEGDALLPLPAEVAAEYKQSWGFDYVHDCALRFTYGRDVPVPSPIPPL